MLAILVATNAPAQMQLTYNIDSLKHLLSNDLSDTNRIWVLNNLGRNISNSDTTVILSEQAIALSQKIGFVRGEAEAYNNIAYWFNQRGNYPRALDYYLRAIKLSEGDHYEAGLNRSYNSISTVYLYLKDYNTSISYARKAIALSTKLNDLNTLALAASWLSTSFLGMHRIDSALKYAQASYEAAARLKEPFPLYLATSRLGAIHAQDGNGQLALEYLRLSLQYSKKDGRFFRIAGVHQQLADLFRSSGKKDSCLFHVKKAFELSEREKLTATLLSSSLLLSNLYEGIDDTESLRYHKYALAARDSLFSQEKNSQVVALTLNENLRQQELAASKRLADEQRKNNLQYAAIALGLVFFTIIFLMLSHSVIANPRLIRFLGVLALLIVFEFINLLLHPVLGSITHHSPFSMLVIMVCIAALLIPIHHRLEKWLIEELVKKNNNIRLTAAKKVIASVEPEKNN